MFTAASLHPAVSAIASVTPQQLDDSHRETAQLFVRLLAESCREQTRQAIRYKGELAIQASFQVLGQVAAAELFASPEVSAGMAGLGDHVDNEKLQTVFERDR